jgi:hypothetical protein
MSDLIVLTELNINEVFTEKGANNLFKQISTIVEQEELAELRKLKAENEEKERIKAENDAKHAIEEEKRKANQAIINAQKLADQKIEAAAQKIKDDKIIEERAIEEKRQAKIKQEQDQKYIDKINKDILADLVKCCGSSNDQAIKILAAIRLSHIRHVKID